MNRRKKTINNTTIPQHEIEVIAHCILPVIEKAHRQNALTLLYLWGLFPFPWSSWLGGGFALHPVAELGSFISVKENK